MPGSNPLFGLNTLGGALSIQTKDGRSTPGTTRAGDLRQRRAPRPSSSSTAAARPAGLHWYLAGNLFGEDGWRDDSPSDVRQFFGKLGWQRATHDVALTAGVRRQLADRQRPAGAAVPRPRLRQRLHQAGHHRQPLDVRQSHDAAQPSATALTFSGNAYYRDIRTNTLNGDINEDSLDQAIYQPSAAERAALAAAGYTGVPASGANAANTPFPFWRCIGNVLLNDEPAEKCNGLINRTRDRAAQRRRVRAAHAGATRSAGTAISSPPAPPTIGAASTSASPRELGYLNPDRSVTGVERVRRRRHRRRRRRRALRHARRSRRPHPHLERLRDRHALARRRVAPHAVRPLQPHARSTTATASSPGGGPGSLDGDHVFSRFNPAAGVTFSPSRALNRLRRLQRRQPRARRRSSSAAPIRTSPASCRTRWPATRRSIRSSPGRGKRACAASTAACSWNAGVFRAGQPRRHPVRHVRADRLRLLQELRQDAPAGARARRRAAGSGASRSAPATPFSTRRSRAKRPSTARATAPTTPRRTARAGSRARSRSSPAIGFRYSAAHAEGVRRYRRSRRRSRWIST